MNDIEVLDNGAIVEQPPTRAEILLFESELARLEQLDCPLQHTFAPGSYARTIALPMGALVVGKIHKHSHLNIVSRGLVTVVTEFGRETIDARVMPVVFTSQAGAKRALYCHSDVVWTTVHLTNSTNLADIERETIASDYEELDGLLASEVQKFLREVRS